jgi:ABC-type phosphate/phosphonate transport system permease subunit
LQVQPVSRRAGLVYALVTTLFWGVWGAFAGKIVGIVLAFVAAALLAIEPEEAT